MFKSFNVEKCDLLHHQIKNDMSTLYSYVSKWLNLGNNVQLMLDSDDSE